MLLAVFISLWQIQNFEIMKRSIGILGGGQLGRMLYESVTPWNVDIEFLDKNSSFPAGKICPQFTVGNFNNYDDVLQFGQDKDVIGIEIEHINTTALSELEASGKKCYPQPRILHIIKDKGLQKQFYRDHQFDTSDFVLFNDRASIEHAIEAGQISVPFVQKARTEGYDGRGVVLINSIEDYPQIMDVPSVIEDKVDIDKELSVIVARNEKGQVEVFPTVEMIVNEKINQLDYQICPANITTEHEERLHKIAIDLMNQWEMVGLLAIEFFLSNDGSILINEVAPRPHNSGHHSIEACNVSQFEQLARVLLGLDLIKPNIVNPSVMLNLVGTAGYEGNAIYKGLESCLKDGEVNVHLYGKDITKPHRKMGHVTIVSENIEKAIEKANFVKKNLSVIA